MTDGDSGTNSDDLNLVEGEAAYGELRRLAFEDALAAKYYFQALLDGRKEILSQVLTLAGNRSAGRVRQIIARAALKEHDQNLLTPFLTSWADGETDEFARIAIQDALIQIGGSGRRRKSSPPEALPDLAATFRYLSTRMRHRVLNVLPRAGLSVDDLRDELLRTSDNHELVSILPYLDELKVSLERLVNAVAFTDEAAHFEVANIRLSSWLTSYSRNFQAEYGSISLKTDFDQAEAEVRVEASQFLLETIFMNLWCNSQQACGIGCDIRVHGFMRNNQLIVYILDSGSGFGTNDKERAFLLQFSTKQGNDGGRGLMEVSEAMRRLSGKVGLEEVPGYGLRVALTFRTVKP